MDQTTLLIILILLAVYEACPSTFRDNWKCQRAVITSIEIGMNNEQDFMQLTRYTLQVFKEQIVKPVKWILEQPKETIIAWLHDEEIDFIEPSNGRKPKLSVEDRIMRALMLNGNQTPKLLKMLFGQEKTTIYEDCWLIMRALCKLFSHQFQLPYKGTRKYLERVGYGIAGEAFPTMVYMMDGHKV